MRKATRFLFTTLLLTSVLCFFGISNSFARVGEEPDMKPVADVMMSSSGISWMPKVNYMKLTLNISGPDGTVFSKTFDNGASPYVNLSDLIKSNYFDGSYTYELSAVSFAGNKVRGDDGFSSLSRETRDPGALTQTGYFTVRNGMIVTPGAMEPENGLSSSQEGLSGTLDQVINDDLIVSFSLCVGNDCVSGENFGFDTLRLKENNLRIHFDDTSSSASFPRNDWRITINDSSNGGASYFRVDDATNGKSPFTIEANTPSNTLYVASEGRIGIGTSTPVVNAHVKDGNTPTLRLEQDSSDGWTSQTWDLAGNESNFFIRDVTNGSELPFRIQPGAPDDLLTLRADGRVGIGTWSPSYMLEVKTSGSPQIAATKESGATMEFSATGSFGIAGTRTDHPVKFRVNSVDIMQINGASPYIQMSSGGATCDGASWP
ncbi:MAG: hypothetical protein GY869_32880, partial [Planctomycetes bacterium]|nr:hypothetical protein [Planctomycetota bacterium]